MECRLTAVVTLMMLAACGVPEDVAQGEADAALSSSNAVCTHLTVLRGSIGSGQGAAALAVADQTGTQDSWSRYVEFAPNTLVACTLTLPAATSAPTGFTLQVSYRGPQRAEMLWTFQAYDHAGQAWVEVATNAFAEEWVWSRAAIDLPAPADRFIRNGAVTMRYGSASAYDASLLDQWVLVPRYSPVSADAGSTVSPDAGSPVSPDAGSPVSPDAGSPVSPDAGSPVSPDAGSGTTLEVGSGKAYATIQAAVNAAQAGDTVLVRAGTYFENVTFPRSGSAAAGHITLKGDPGAILDGTGKGAEGISIAGKSYLKVVGLTVRNYKGSGVPIGISVTGGSSYLEIRNNLVHNIENANGNAHGIAFYGDAATPISNLIVDGNEIRDCKLGQSESMVLNGNVTDFVVSHNVVHDNDNIGIDFIGFEGVGPAGSDQARNGVCTDNVVYNISSATNPTYGGERSADGIYVDGGKDIVIERNRVDNADIGIELASEHSGKSTANITVRNNFVSRSFQGSVMAGGYASNKGNATNIVIVNNTLYQGGDGEVVLQYNCSGVTVKNNIFYARSGNSYVLSSGGNNTGVTLDTNLYFGASTSSAGSYSDPHPKFANPLLVSPYANLHLGAGSPAINTGLALGNDASGAPLSGLLDVDGNPRVTGAAINLGAHEL